MKTNLNIMFQKNLQRTGRGLLAVSLLLAAGCFNSCKDEYDLDEKLPPNFGSNLMTHLENNGFKTYARLAKDLNYENELSGVALKTLLAADDEAFKRFFENGNNKWGVRSYEELTIGQKSLLFYSSMLDNSLQVMDLSTTSGTIEAVDGNAMRRKGEGSEFDTVTVMHPEDMPYDENKPNYNPYWKYYKTVRKEMVCMTDMTVRPIVFFVEPFLRAKRITDQDMKILLNLKGERAPQDANINNTKIGLGTNDRNTRCPNGFIHRVEDVLMPLDNMAEIITRNPKTAIMGRALERFSAPHYAGKSATDKYNSRYYPNGGGIDSLFIKRYFAKRSVGELENTTIENGPAVEAVLKFDPEWNSFYSNQPGIADTTVKLQSNMAVMIVPSDAAMEKYINGDGIALKEGYGDWDNIPNKLWAKFISNGMLNSFTESVPSKFDGIVNDNKDKMNIKPNDIDSVIIGCNGAIYVTKKAFPPTDFISVVFPTLANPSMSIFDWYIQLDAGGERPGYDSFLNSLDAYYSFFVPTDEALKNYIDPRYYAFADSANQKIKFFFDGSKKNMEDRVWARSYTFDRNNPDAAPTDSFEILGVGTICRYLKEIFDSHIIIGKKTKIGEDANGIPMYDVISSIENGHNYYRTKNGGIIAVNKVSDDEIYVQGTLQRDENKWVRVSRVYDQTKGGGNGKVYVLDGEESEPLMTTRKSVCDILKENEEFSFFYTLVKGSKKLISPISASINMGSTSGNISAFNNFNYTVYVPTNESLQAMFNNKEKYNLYTWAEIAEYEDSPLKEGETQPVRNKTVKQMEDSLETFIRYHFQDNLLMIGLDYANDGGGDYDKDGHFLGGSDTFTRNYETASMDNNDKFYTVEVNNTPTAMQVKDRCKNTRNIITEKVNGKELYNLTAREYNFSGGNIQVSSFATVHLIDGPLLINSK